jgi:hypothetical protein
MVSAVKAKLGAFKKVKNVGRSAREFTFSLTIRNKAVKAFGLAVATSPKSIKAIYALYMVADVGAGKKAQTFVSSFLAK